MPYELLEADLPHLGILLGFTAIIGFFSTAIIAVVASQWRRVREADIEANLKATMLEQGMSATEIREVIESGRGRRRKEWRYVAKMMHDHHKKQGCC